MATQYQVSLKSDFRANQRRRAGLLIDKNQALITELTDEQLKALEADERINVKMVGVVEEPKVDKQKLMRSKRKKLNKIADELGIEGAEEFSTKEEVVDAILVKEAEE